MPKPRKQSGSRKLQHRMYILCEGMKNKSESAYFKALIRECKFVSNKIDVKVIDTEKKYRKRISR